MRKFLLFLISGIISIISIISLAQEKAPEISDDYVWIHAGDSISVNVMENDWCMEGHTMSILNFWQGTGGYASMEDSIISYASDYFYKGVDTIRYMLVDNDNGLFSETGNLVITVENNGRANLDVNNIEATFNSFGFQFSTLPDFENGFIVPKGGGIVSIFSQSFWMGGYDENDQLHIAGERYRMSGEDYFPGPVSEIYPNSFIPDWNYVSKLSKEELEYHDTHWFETNYEPVESILNWPAHGDVTYGQNHLIAPFYDRNGDGQYDPYVGDRPFVRGDQAVWSVYNESMFPHTETDGEIIGAEMHIMGYAYDCSNDSVFNNTLFVQLQVINRSENAYHDFFIANFTDLDLGNAWDDFVGCDTLTNSFYAYNGDDNDEDDNVMLMPGYGYHPPAQGIVFLNQEMSSFIVTSNATFITADPYTPEGYYNVMTGTWRAGEPLTYGGLGYGGDETVKYQYPGDPLSSEGWSEVTAGNSPGDRRGIGTCGPFDFNPGDTLTLDVAYIFARDYEGDNLSSVALMKERISLLKWYYDNDSIPCGQTWSSIGEKANQNQGFNVFPNPCENFLTCEYENELPDEYSFSVRDLMGKTLMSGTGNTRTFEISTRNLKSGIYILEVKDKISCSTLKFIKK